MTRPLVTFLLLVSLTPHARAFAGGESTDAQRASSSRPSSSALARAEKLLDELARLDGASTATRAGETRRAARKASEIFLRAQELPEGDLKVDLSTAARLYERAFARASARKSAAPDSSSNAASSSCSDERPGAYRSLCARLSPRDAVALFIVKARRHTEWARASVAEGRGGSNAPSEALEEMRGERALDLVVARQAIAALVGLEELADPPATLAGYEEAKKIGKVSPAEFGTRLDAAARTVERSLAWLPESPLKAEIDRAWQSYSDALWWWERGERGAVVKVTNDRYAAHDFAEMARVSDVQLGYNAVVNLRHAREYTRRAEALAEAGMKRAGFAAGN